MNLSKLNFSTMPVVWGVVFALIAAVSFYFVADYLIPEVLFSSFADYNGILVFCGMFGAVAGLGLFIAISSKSMALKGLPSSDLKLIASLSINAMYLASFVLMGDLLASPLKDKIDSELYDQIERYITVIVILFTIATIAGSFAYCNIKYYYLKDNNA